MRLRPLLRTLPQLPLLTLTPPQFACSPHMRRNIVRWTNAEERHFEFSVGDARYTARPVLTEDLSHLERNVECSLITLLRARARDLEDPGWLERNLQAFRDLKDDVWTSDFLDGLLISTVDSLCSPLSPALLASIRSSTSWHAIVSGSNLQAGPYVLSRNVLSQVYRLYDDEKGAFMVPVKPASPNNRSFEPLGIAGSAPQSLSVAVPSRIPTLLPSDLPLLGKRIAVKELFCIRGLRMALSNRAFYAVSGPAQTTAPAIRKLLDEGAIMVGSTKCSSMISREDPVEAIDFQAPFNPRGDGYQSPVGSSSGSAAAIASYDWMDYAIGSDTTGSSRRPAFVNGCFQLRFSQAALSLEGVRPCFSRFDAPALFARDIDGLETCTKAWIGPEPHGKHQKPTVLIYPLDYLPVANTRQQELLDAVIQDVAKCCNIPIQRMSIKKLWLESPPTDAAGKSLEVYLQDAGQNSFVYDFYHNSDEFRSTYEQEYHRAPFTNRVTRWRWDIGHHITLTQRNDAMQRIDVYKDWVLQHVLHVDNETALVVLPVQDVEPNYRDTDPGPPFAQDVWDPLWLSPVLKAPEITVPVGDITYSSRISKRLERLPVAVSFLGPPGTDVMLASTLKSSFKAAARPLSVNVGSNMYD